MINVRPTYLPSYGVFKTFKMFKAEGVGEGGKKCRGKRNNRRRGIGEGDGDAMTWSAERKALLDHDYHDIRGDTL